MANNDWVVWFNGAIVPESQARVPFRDRGFKYGDAVFDTTRTFGHRIFKLDEHLDRLFKSLKYLRIDPGYSHAELKAATEAVAERILAIIPAEEDIWLTQRVTRGIDAAERDQWDDYPERTVIVESRPLPLRQRGHMFRDGMRVVTPTVRRTPSESISPRTKTNNYLNLVLADLEVRDRDPEALAVLLDTNGNLSEGRGSNIFLVRDGKLLTPREQHVLAGVSRQTVMDLAAEQGIPCAEADLDLYDAATADEIFITSTSFCICPVSSFNGAKVGGGQVGDGGAMPGPITKRLVDAYVRFVDFDWYGQYLRFSNT